MLGGEVRQTLTLPEQQGVKCHDQSAWARAGHRRESTLEIRCTMRLFEHQFDTERLGGSLRFTELCILDWAIGARQKRDAGQTRYRFLEQLHLLADDIGAHVA